MKKNRLVFGLTAGLISSAWMVISVATNKGSDMEGTELYGFSMMFLSFLLIYFAVRKHRDQLNGGVISFGQAFKTGFYVSLIASTVYVCVWMVDYYFFIPDFMESYADYQLEKLKSTGANESAITHQVTENEEMIELYKNPMFVVLFTYLEILPVGLVVTLIVAFVLKRKSSST
jgi:hypothetical protein